MPLLLCQQNRPLDARLQEEIIEAVKLVCGEAVLSDALVVVNRLYYTQQNTRNGLLHTKHTHVSYFFMRPTNVRDV
jgi:RNase P/RNase MRP subunit POP5